MPETGDKQVWGGGGGKGEHFTNNENFFLMVLQAEKTKVKAQADPECGENWLPGL